MKQSSLFEYLYAVEVILWFCYSMNKLFVLNL